MPVTVTLRAAGGATEVRVLPDPVVTTPSSLPTPWVAHDIGLPALAGAASFASGVFTVKGAGIDVWEVDDQCQFVHQTRAGDGQIVARVKSQQNTNNWAKTGVMVKASTAVNAPYAMVAVTPAQGINFQSGFTQTVAAPAIAPPAWLKLTRVGNTVTGYSSADGSIWTQVGSATVNLPSSAEIGLFVTSHNAAAVNTSTFDNVVVGAVTAPPVEPPPPSGSGTLLNLISQLTRVFSPNPHSPPSPGGDYTSSGGGWIKNVDTPYGVGYEMVVTPVDVTPWSPNTVCMLTGRDWPNGSQSTRINKNQRWTWQMYMPSQTLVTEDHAGVLWEIGHTGGSSGHHISLDPGATMRIGRQTVANDTIFSYVRGIPIVWDRWHPYVMELRYSTGSDGYMRVWIDGKQWLNYSGATWFNDGEPTLQFGWYRRKGTVKNTVRFADIRYTST